jgi:hypothetical protein
MSASRDASSGAVGGSPRSLSRASPISPASDVQQAVVGIIFQLSGNARAHLAGSAEEREDMVRLGIV